MDEYFATSVPYFNIPLELCIHLGCWPVKVVRKPTSQPLDNIQLSQSLGLLVMEHFMFDKSTLA